MEALTHVNACVNANVPDVPRVWHTYLSVESAPSEFTADSGTSANSEKIKHDVYSA